jgi:hypothetical protein
MHKGSRLQRRRAAAHDGYAATPELVEVAVIDGVRDKLGW